MAGLNYPDIVNSVNQGYDRGQNLQFNQLAGQAIQDPTNASSSIGLAAAINPGKALQVQQQIQDAQDAKQKKISGAANYVLSAYKSGNPAQVQGAYQAVRPFLSQLSQEHGDGSPPPDQFSEDMLPHIYQLVAQGGGVPVSDPKVIGPGGVLTDNTGREIYRNPFGQQYENVPMGEGKVSGVFDKNTGTIKPAVPLPGAGAAPQVTGLTYQGANGQPANPVVDEANALLAKGVPPDQAAAAMSAKYKLQLGASTPSLVLGNDGQFRAGTTSDQTAPLDQGQGGAPGAPGPQFGVGTPRPREGRPTVTTLSPEETASIGLPAGTVAQRDSTGRVSVVGRTGASSGADGSGLGLSDDAVENAAWDKVLMGKNIPGFSKAAIDQRTEVANKVAEIAKQAGVSPQELSTTQGRVKALQSSMTNLQKQGDVQAKNEETFLNNADILLNLSDKVGRTGIPAFNGLILNAKTNVAGDPDAASFAAARNIVANEYSKIASGATGAAGSTQGSQEHALSLINGAQTPDQLRSVIGTLHQDIEGQKKATADQLDLIHQRMQQFGTTSPTSATSGQPSGQGIPQAAIDHLRQNPALSTYFDQKYGQGASAKALGQ